MSGYDKIRRNLVAITKTLKSTHGAREKLTLHYKQNEWIDITENPLEDELVTLALMRIKQDPNQYDLFVSMLHDIEGMDLVVNTIITSGVTTATTHSPSTFPPTLLTNVPPPMKIDQSRVTSSCHLRPSPFTLVVTHSPSVTTTSPILSRYADFLRAVYENSPVAKSDKFPHTPSKVYIKLALVKKEKVSRADADRFTCLTLQGDIDQILHVKEQIEMDDILKEDDKTRLVVVEGAPGIGKSTLAWELCRQWPTMESLKRFSIVVLLRLQEEGVQSATDISHLLYHRDIELCRCVGEEVERREGEGVLFVFDGFDEFPTELREKSLVMDIISGSKYLPRATVLVTSRPSASAQLQSLFQSGISKHIEVVGFSEKEILEYAGSVFAHATNANLMANFTTYLTVNPVVKGMMYNPLNCAIVVEVYRETSESGKPIPHTQTQLYTELTLCLLSRYLSATGDPLARKLPDRLEP